MTYETLAALSAAVMFGAGIACLIAAFKLTAPPRKDRP